MKASALRNMAAGELENQLEELFKEQFNLRMQQGAGQLARPSLVKAVRRDIARIKTILTEMKAGRHQ